MDNTKSQEVLERELAQSIETINRLQERLDDMLSSVTEVIWSRRPKDLSLEYISGACTSIFGYTPGELLENGGILFDHVYPEDRKSLDKQIERTIKDGYGQLEYRIIHKDGSIKYIYSQAHVKRDEAGNILRYNGTSIDITEQKKLQEKLQYNEHNLRALIDNTKDSIWSVDKNLNILMINDAYRSFIYKHTGIEVKEGVSALWKGLPEDFLATRELDYRRCLNGETFSVIHNITVSGETLYAETSFNPIRDVNGSVIGVSCVSRDISENRKQLLKIQEQNERLKEIAWIQSHKIRGPVAHIMGLVQLFGESGISDDTRKEIMEALKIVTTELDEVIHSVLGKSGTH